jgi:hypothetical protein
MEPESALKAPWQRFTLRSAAAWLVLAILCSLMAGIKGNSKSAFGVAVPLGLLIVAFSRSYEIRIRQTHLPREGWTPWCFRLTVMLCVVAGWLGYLEHNYRSYIPGLCQNILTFERDYKWLAKDGSTGEIKGIGWEETRDVPRNPVRGGAITFPLTPPNSRLRFYSQRHLEEPGWMIRSQRGSLIRESDGKCLPWNGDGLLQVMEELSGAPYPAAERPHLSAIANAASLTWSRGGIFDLKTIEAMMAARGGYRFPETSGRTSSRSRDCPWWGAVFFSSIWAMITTGIFFSAKATMGSIHGQVDPDEQD